MQQPIKTNNSAADFDLNQGADWAVMKKHTPAVERRGGSRPTWRSCRSWCGSRNGLTRRDVLFGHLKADQAETILAAAYANKQYGAAVTALREKAVLSGHRIERSEIGGPGEFESMNDDELERVLIERLGELGFSLSPIVDIDSETEH
jgi:hypothetical protein